MKKTSFTPAAGTVTIEDNGSRHPSTRASRRAASPFRIGPTDLHLAEPGIAFAEAPRNAHAMINARPGEPRYACLMRRSSRQATHTRKHPTLWTAGAAASLILAACADTPTDPSPQDTAREQSAIYYGCPPGQMACNCGGSRPICLSASSGLGCGDVCPDASSSSSGSSSGSTGSSGGGTINQTACPFAVTVTPTINSVGVSFDTPTAVPTGVAVYTTGGTFATSAVNPSASTDHSYALTPLAPNTSYEFVVLINGAQTCGAPFATLPTTACTTMCANAPANAIPVVANCDASCTAAANGQVPSLDTWLLSYPNVASRLTWRTPTATFVGWSSFTSAMQTSIRTAYSQAWTWLGNDMAGEPFGLVDPPPNQLASTLGPNDPPSTALSQSDAWSLWSTHVGLMMAIQFGRRVPWDLADLDSSSLAQLLDSRSMFLPETVSGNPNPLYRVEDSSSTVTGLAVPASPSTEYSFLVTNNLIGASRRATIDLILDWVRTNLFHFGGPMTLQTMEDIWQYPGWSPVARMLSGTTAPNPEGFGHWTLGCWGTTAMLKSLLMTVQVPVANGHSTFVSPGYHAVPYFVSERMFLDHGDDPYDALSRADPPFPIDELLLDATAPANQLSVSTSPEGLPLPLLQDDSPPHATVGKQPVTLAIASPPLFLVSYYCADQASGASPATGQVYAWLSDNEGNLTYDLTALENAGLWDHLQQKASSVGGCANFHFP